MISKEEYYEFHESRAELKWQRDYDNLPDDCKECRYLGCNECLYEKETGHDCDCWKNDSVKCSKCAWSRKENENAELYCEYNGDFCECEETECEFYTEGDDCK